MHLNAGCMNTHFQIIVYMFRNSVQILLAISIVLSAEKYDFHVHLRKVQINNLIIEYLYYFT